MPPDDMTILRLSEQLTRLAEQVAKGIETINGPVVTEVRTNSVIVENLQTTVQNLAADTKEMSHTVNKQNFKLASIEKDTEQIKDWVQTQEKDAKEKQKELSKQNEEQRSMRQRTYLTIGLVLVGYFVQLMIWLVSKHSPK